MTRTVTSNHGDATPAPAMLAMRSSNGWDTWLERVLQARYPADIALTDGCIAWTATDEAHGFEIVRLGRELVRLNNANRKIRQDTPPSEKTLADYQKKCRQIDREITQLADHEPEPLITVMGKHAVKARSFTAIKSALKWRAIQRVKDLLRSQDAMQVASGRDTAWLAHVTSLYGAICTFIEADALNREECLDFTGRSSKAGRSKRADLPYLPDGWQDRFLDITAKDGQYNDVGVLMVYCGLRPVELAKGVKVSATPEGVSVQITGGKVRDTAGQPWRSFVLKADGLPKSFVHRVQESAELNITAEPDALRAYLNRLSDEVFLQGDYRSKGARQKNFVLSAYTFRHALVTELRQDGWETASIAAIIGESSAKTVTYYGTRSRKGPRPTKMVAVLKGSERTARPVRSIDMQGLDDVQKRGKSLGKAKPNKKP